MSKTLGLALGSGGSRGVAHAGFLMALEEENIIPNYIAGCSMGAVIGACYAKGMTALEIKEAILGIKMRDIVDVSVAAISKMSILRSKKMRDLLVEYLGNTNLEDMKIPFRCVATDLMSGKLHTFKRGSAVKAVQASSTIPTVFRPVKSGSGLYVDGGCLCRVPVKAVKDMGADVVVAIDVLTNAAEPIDKVHNIVSMALRVFDIMDTHQTKQRRELEKGLCNLWLEPEIKDMSQYVIKHLDRAYEAGYSLGKENVENIKNLLES